jgi:multiple sugar transport system permease protein
MINFYILSQRLKQALVYVALGAIAVATLMPFFWMISTSLKGGNIFTYPPEFWPSQPTLMWYTKLFREVDFPGYFLNSLIVALSSTGLNLLLNSLAGYAFAKHRFRGRETTFALLMTTLMVPGQVMMIPVFLLLKNIGLLNSYAGLILPAVANFFGIFLMRQYISTIPNDLIESARIDGCSEFRIYWSVILPLCKPVLATLAIFSFMASWNDFLWPLIVMIREDRYTLPVALASLNGQHPTEFGLLMAASVIVMAPVVLVFMAAQKFVIRGIATTGIKE